MIPIKGRGFINQGSGTVTPKTLAINSLESPPLFLGVCFRV